MEIIYYLDSWVTQTKEMSFRALENTRVGRELTETNLEIKNSQKKESQGSKY